MPKYGKKFIERKNCMKNTFIKIICLGIALMMLLSACTNGGVENPTEAPTENPTEAPTTGGSDETTTGGNGGNNGGSENLFAPSSPKQILFDTDMNIADYISGLGTAYEVEVVSVNEKSVLKVTCKKKSGSSVTFDYAKYMSDYNVNPVDGANIEKLVFMIKKDANSDFERVVSSATELYTTSENGKVATVTLKALNTMKKNDVWYISSVALAEDSYDVLRFSDLSVYALGYSDKIKIENYDPVVHEELTAPAEDENLLLWFDHATERVPRYSIAPTDRVGYTIQMAKNEIEACQFFLHSPTNKKITINLSNFTNDQGETLITELGVEYYIEEGYISIKGYPNDLSLVVPDAVVPYESYISMTEGGNYEEGNWVTIGPYTYKNVTRDTSQGFVIQAKSTADTTPGLYGATLEIYDAETGECIKKAKVYTYVYDVTLDEEPDLDSVFLVWDGLYAQQFAGNQQGDALIALYDFMLDYRMTPTLSSWVISDLLCQDGNYEWLYNTRLTTLRVYNQAQYNAWKDDPILSQKIYYYGQDEPGVPRGTYRVITLADGSTVSYYDTYGILTIMGIAEEAEMLESWGWEDYKLLVPFERNPILSDLTTYPSIDQSLGMNLTWDKVEASLIGEGSLALFNKYKDDMIAAGDMLSFISQYVNMWVPCLFGYTPGALDDYFTGCLYLQSASQDSTYGEINDRIEEYVERGDEKWTYVACTPKYSTPYQNLLLFCDGTEPQTMLWTCYYQDVTGFLYWHVSNYGVDSKVNDTFTMRCPFPAEGAGDGILFYPGSVYGQIDPIPSLRVIGLRDGIEDYELLSMLEDMKGEAFAKELCSFIATSAVTYTEDDDLLQNVRSYMLRLLESGK